MSEAIVINVSPIFHCVTLMIHALYNASYFCSTLVRDNMKRSYPKAQSGSNFGNFIIYHKCSSLSRNYHLSYPALDGKTLPNVFLIQQKRNFLAIHLEEKRSNEKIMYVTKLY